MSADEDGLIRAILADPHDTLARAAYADWLEERGKPVHAQLYRGVKKVDQERKLTGQLDKAIKKAHPDSRAGTLYLNRGVLAGRVLQMKMPPSAFISKKFQACAGEILREYHVVRLVLSGTTKDWTKVGDAPAMPAVRSLVVGDGRDGPGALARCAGLGGLFSLAASHFKAHGLIPLVTSEYLKRLVHLDLHGLKEAAEALPALASGPLAGRLQHLALGQARLHGAGFSALLRADALLGGLTTLSLSHNDLDDAEVGTLASSPHLGRLRSLNLSSNALTDVGMTALARSSLAARLRWVNVSHCEAVTDDGHRALAAALHPDCRVKDWYVSGPAERRRVVDIYGGRWVGE